MLTTAWSMGSWYDQYWNNTVHIADDIAVYWGSSDDACLIWSTGQTADALMLAVGADSNNLIIGTKANIITNAYDLGLAASTDPQLVITSATAWSSAGNKLKRGRIYHDGSNLNIISDTGSVIVNDELIVTTNIIPDASNTDSIGSTSYEFLNVYLGDGATSGLYLGTGQEAHLYYNSALILVGTLTASNAAGPAFADEAATTTNPTLIPDKAEMDTGWGWASDTLHAILGGASEYSFSASTLAMNANTITGCGTITANDAAGPTIVNEAASTTNPTLCPDRAEDDTGIGWASDTLHLVLGGASEYSFSTSTLAMNANTITGAGSITANDAAGPIFVNEAASTTNPTLCPDRAEDDTGIGWASDTLHFILGGTSYANLSTTLLTLAGDIALTGGGTIQNDTGDIVIDSAGAINLDMTTVSSVLWAGVTGLKLNNAAVSEYIIGTAAAGTSVYFRGQSGADNGAGNGYTGGSIYWRAGNGGDATGGNGGAGGSIILEPGADGSGGTPSGDGTVSILAPGGVLGTGDLKFYSTGSYTSITSGSGITGLILGINGTYHWTFNATQFYPKTPNAQSIGIAANATYGVYVGEDTSTGSKSASGLYLGLTQETRLRWNKDATGYPAASLILGLNAVGSAAKDTIAFSAAAITGFNALTTVAGSNLYAAMQSGLDSNAAGGSLYWSGGTAHGSGTGGSLFLTPGGTTSGARGAVVVYQANILTTATDALVLENATASDAVNTVQYSPAIRFRAHAWDTPTDLVDRYVDWRIYVLPVSGATVESTLYFGHSLNGAAYTAPMTVSSGGYIGATAISVSSVYKNGGTLTLQTAALSAADSAIEACTGTWTNSTGAAVAFELKPVWNQTGDASAIGLLVNPTETAIGTGGYVPIDVRRNGKASTPTDGILLTNTTAALVGAQVQMGPRLRIHGAAWKSDATAASQNHDWSIEALPVAGAAATTSILKFGESSIDAAYTYPFTVTSAGAGTFLSTVTATGFSVSGAACYYVGGTDVAVTDGGTGLSAYAVGDIVYASAATTLAGLTAVAAGQVLVSAGVTMAPAWSSTLAITTVTVATGGAIQTGATDDNYVVFNARDNGTGYKEVARLTGAAEPYLSLVQAKFGTGALAADSAHRGMLYVTEGGAGAADVLYWVAKGADNNYTAIQVAIG